jgi:ribosome biogenesis GTP-binding protein YlqF
MFMQRTKLLETTVSRAARKCFTARTTTRASASNAERSVVLKTTQTHQQRKQRRTDVPPMTDEERNDSFLDEFRFSKTNQSARNDQGIKSDDADDRSYKGQLKQNSNSVRLVQWYPGHIARAEKMLKEQLRNVDCVVEVRDLRIPLATSHPDVEGWTGEGKMRITVLNRADMVDDRERNKWVMYFKKLGHPHVVVTDAKTGRGVDSVKKIALSVAKDVNSRRIEKGLLARPVRTAVVGYPNVGKSALINRLVGKKACASAPRPGVTRDLRWVRVSDEIDLLDSPGVLPPRMSDQDAANRLAMANDIGEASYEAQEVASRLFEEMRMLQCWRREHANIGDVVKKRYKMSQKDIDDMTGDMFIEKIALSTCGGDFQRAGMKVLNDFRGGFLGKFSLEEVPSNY